MSDFTVNMFSTADKTPGQGVGSAYLEQVKLVKDGGAGKFDVIINDKQPHEIQHFHTLNLKHYYRLRRNKNKSVNVVYVHFLPHTLDGSIKLPWPLFKLFKRYVMRFYRKADHLVVVNPIFIKELMDYNIPAKKINYIPNYVSKEQFHPLDKDKIAKIKEKYHIDPNKKVVLSAGQIQTRKGVNDFLEVAKLLPDVTFVWAGGFSFKKITDGYKELKAKVDKAPNNVKFIGIIPREEMNDIYNIADVVFMPSYNELFPMTILESVNIGTPLVLRNLELYEDILFKKYLACANNEEFAKAINDLLTNPEIYKKYHNYSLEISDFYSKERVYQQWEDFYYRVLAEKKEVK